jgi:hypothetical protein
MKTKINYRVWQFWQSLKRSPRDHDWDVTSKILSSEELDLIKQLPAADQNHSLRVFHSLLSQGEEDPDLLKAALLHDLGKIRYPLRRWERVLVVLLTGIFPQRVKGWGEGKPVGLRRPLVVIRQHPHWGAELAQAAGSNPRTVWLIRNHEEDELKEEVFERDLALLRKLQTADNTN